MGRIDKTVALEPDCDLATRIERRVSALTAPELADLLGLSKTTIYDWAKQGRIPHFNLSGAIRFDPAATAAWLRSRTVNCPEGRAA
jgi:excisionase family DNA binding protein